MIFTAVRASGAGERSGTCFFGLLWPFALESNMAHRNALGLSQKGQTLDRPPEVPISELSQ